MNNLLDKLDGLLRASTQANHMVFFGALCRAYPILRQTILDLEARNAEMNQERLADTVKFIDELIAAQAGKELREKEEPIDDDD